MYRWVILLNLQEPFIWTVVSCAIIFQNEQTKANQNSWDEHCKETSKLSGSFENTAKFDWQPMELLENGRCLCVAITICDNASKCVLKKNGSLGTLKRDRLLKRELQ